MSTESKGIDAAALTRFMEEQGYQLSIAGNYEHTELYWFAMTNNAAQHWYATVDAALKLVEHTDSCKYSTGKYQNQIHVKQSCYCDAEQINALLIERRKEAGL